MYIYHIYIYETSSPYSDGPKVFDRFAIEVPRFVAFLRVLQCMITHWKIPVNQPQSKSFFMMSQQWWTLVFLTPLTIPVNVTC